MSFAASYRTDLIETLETIDTAKVEQAIEWLREARDSGRTIYTCGNGGSASSASHIVCDILKGASYQRDKRFRVLGLADSLSTMTAYSNDVDYAEVFVEQLKNWAQPGDVVIALSGSGNSANVVKALDYANSVGCKTIALTGRDGGKLAPLGQLNIHIPVEHMGRIEDAHMTILHMIAYAFMEQEI
jgi:D-sedoheptulose 7-phosphate isomerase